MFPNQQSRDSWGSVAGYYGNYGMGGGSWYNWAGGQHNSVRVNSWGYHASSPPPDTESYVAMDIVKVERRLRINILLADIFGGGNLGGISAETAAANSAAAVSALNYEREREQLLLERAAAASSQQLATAAANSQQLLPTNFSLADNNAVANPNASLGSSSGGKSPGKLGINTNIYSIYQNRGHTVNISPDVTISHLPGIGRIPRDGESAHQAGYGSGHDRKGQPEQCQNNSSGLAGETASHSGGDSAAPGVGAGQTSAQQSNSDSLFNACMQESPLEGCNNGVVDGSRVDGVNARVYGASSRADGAGARGDGGEPVSRRERDRDMHSEGNRDDERAAGEDDHTNLVIDEEPDSSTDMSLTGGREQQRDPTERINQHKPSGDEDKGVDEVEDYKRSKHFSEYFKVKAEPDLVSELQGGLDHRHKHRPKFFKSPRREFSDLLKEANEKMVSKLYNNHHQNLHHGQTSGANQQMGHPDGPGDLGGQGGDHGSGLGGAPHAHLQQHHSQQQQAAGGQHPRGSQANGGLPLSVEIEEYENGSSAANNTPDGLSPPPRSMSMSFLPNSMITNTLSPRKRGRKPKHYSDILFELGQRGISITKTQKSLQQAAARAAARAAGGRFSPSQYHQGGVYPSQGSPNGSGQGGGEGPPAKAGSNQQLKCPHCNKILTTSVGLMYHIRLHTGEKPYSCDLCGKSFATSSHYHYHIRTHSGEKPYRCDFCGKMYTASGSLRLHLKSHLSRLAANAFNINNNNNNNSNQGGGSGGANGNSNNAGNGNGNDAMSSMFRGLEAMLESKAGVAGSHLSGLLEGNGGPRGQHEFKFSGHNIKQEIFDSEHDLSSGRMNEVPHHHHHPHHQQQPHQQQHHPSQHHQEPPQQHRAHGHGMGGGGQQQDVPHERMDGGPHGGLSQREPIDGHRDPAAASNNHVRPDLGLDLRDEEHQRGGGVNNRTMEDEEDEQSLRQMENLRH